MDSFHRSRARIFFELLCALGISASLVGAWQQTYADALLAAAGFTGLYALALLFDLMRRRPSMPVAQVPVTGSVTDDASEVVAVTSPPATVEAESKPAAPAPRAKAPRKPRASRKQTKAAPASEAEVVRIATPAPETDEVGADEIAHTPLAPLFEPEPFVRQQQRALFGRKAG
ncbi:MAG TPA: hypothetical protein VJM15_06915 [Sphingomicrobium sp.]|nr:hypothetical protein [Sphingomicrobium sp.]